MVASLSFEKKAKEQGFELIVGVDEAGRGPLAGPVVASAVLLNNYDFNNRIDDSKKITPLQRENAFHEIHQNGCVGVGIVSEAVIDSSNILQATFFAMGVAVSNLISGLPKLVTDCQNFDRKVLLLIDGKFFKTTLPYSYQTVVAGDSLSLSIACASIIAKVTRDRILTAYDKIFPQYGFKQNKGYGTIAHREAIRRFGPSPIHRRTFNFK